MLQRFKSQNLSTCGLEESARAYDGTGCEFESWQCRINIPCSWSLLGSFWGSLGTHGLIQKLYLKKNANVAQINYRY